jgi:hypothetical protein
MTGRHACQLVLLALASSLLSLPARADDASEKAVCSAKYQSAQRLRAAGKLALARADLLRCAEPSCPAFVSSDCTTWLAQLEADLPTLVFVVLDAQGHDVPGAVVRVDGNEVAHATDGLGHTVDPGERAVEVVAAGQRTTQRIVVRTGEKSRRVEVRLAPGSGGVAPEPAPEPEKKRIPTAAIGLGVVGVIGIGVGSVLWITGSSAASSYNDACGTPAGCTDSQRSSARNQLIAGDVAWGVGLAAGVAAAVVYFSWRHDNAAPQVSIGAGGVTFAGRF